MAPKAMFKTSGACIVSEILITPAQLQEAMAREPWLIFDVRHNLADHDAGRREYDEGHIPGALYLDHEQQLAAPSTGLNGRHPLPSRDDFAALMHGMGLRDRKSTRLNSSH